MQPGQGEAVEVLDTAHLDSDPSPVEGSGAARNRWPAAVIAVLALGLAGWLMSGEGQPAPPAPRPPPTTVPPAWNPAGDLLVGATSGGLVVVDTADGADTLIAIAGSPLTVAAGPPGEAFVHLGDGTVILVDLVDRGVEEFATGVTWFTPSSTAGRVWLRYGARPDTIVEIDSGRAVHARVDRSDLPVGDPRFGHDGGDRLTVYTDQGLRTLGDRQLVATTPSNVYADLCDDGRCRVQRRSADGAGSWTSIVAVPRLRGDVMISGDERWLLSMGTFLSVYDVDRVGVSLVHTSAVDAVFSPDSRWLYVVTDGGLDVVDLAGAADRTVPLPPAAASAFGWEVVASAPDNGWTQSWR